MTWCLAVAKLVPADFHANASNDRRMSKVLIVIGRTRG
jgi:hypothetical protein